MKAILRTILVVILIFLSIRTNNAQTKIYLPVILSDGKQVMEYPILSISNGTDTINFLDPGSGIRLADPYWTPNVAQLKGGGTFVNPSNADGQALVSANYDNVVETIPLEIYAPEGYKTVERARKIFQMSVNAQQYYTASFEQNQVYFAVKPKGDNFLTGYAAVYTIALPNLQNPFGTPFNNDIDDSAFVDLSLIINREPFFSPVLPGEYIGSLKNVLQNSKFDYWNSGYYNNPPDFWNYETFDVLYPDTEQKGIRLNNIRKKYGDYSAELFMLDSNATEYVILSQTFIPKGNQDYTYIINFAHTDIIGGELTITIIKDLGNEVIYTGSAKRDMELLYVVDNLIESNEVELEIKLIATETFCSGSAYIDMVIVYEGDFEDYLDDNLLAFNTGALIYNKNDIAESYIGPRKHNYTEWWNVPGDYLAQTNTQFINKTDYILNDVFLGNRLTGDVRYFTNTFDPDGNLDSLASSNNYLPVSFADNDVHKVASFVITDSNFIKNSVGYFNTVLRVKDVGNDPTDLLVTVSYSTTLVGETYLIKNVSPDMSGQWTDINLTQYDKLNANYKEQYPSRIQINVYMQKLTGSDDTYIDFLMLLPIDEGGFYVQGVNLKNNESLIIKPTGLVKTQESISDWTLFYEVIKNNFDATWQLVFSDGLPIVSDDAILYHPFSFRDNLGDDYRAMLKLNPYTAELLDWFDMIFPAIPAAYADPPLFSNMVIFNNDIYRLYNAWLYESDGTTFPGTQVADLAGFVTKTLPYTSFLLVADNKIYIVFNEITLAPPDTAFHLVSYDSAGTTLINSFDGEQVTAIPVFFNSELYIASDSYLHIYNLVTETWRQISYPAAVAGLSPYASLFTFENNIVVIFDAVSNDPSQVYSFDGVNWTLMSEITKSNPSTNNATGFLIYNNEYYVSYTSLEAQKSSDLLTWVTVGTDLDYLRFAFVFNDILYALSGINSPDLYTFSNVSNSIQNLPDFEGTELLLKNRTINDYKYQRIYALASQINDTSIGTDEYEIVVAYRPQYFSLINKDDF